MKETAEQRHRRLTEQFMMSLAPVIGQSEDKAIGQMMVIIETVEFGVMMVLHQHFHLRPSDCAEMMETALDQAIKRFSKHNNKEEEK